MDESDCRSKLQQELKAIVDEEVNEIEKRLEKTETNGEAGDYIQSILYYNANILGYGIMQMTALQSEVRDVSLEEAFQDIFDNLSGAIFRTVVRNMELDLDYFNEDTPSPEKERTSSTQSKH